MDITMSLPKACRRIQRELALYQSSPADFIPSLYIEDNNLYRVYFRIIGPADSHYAGGEYVGVLILDADYPMSPPEIRMLTPSGRFYIDKPICTSFTNFHPESWCPTYTFSTILTSFVSFMLDESPASLIAVGSVSSTPEEKRLLASESGAYNERKGFHKWPWTDQA